MKWKFVVVGKPSLKYARIGIEEYLKRLRRYCNADLITVKNGSSKEEGERLMRASEGAYRIVFDERGEFIDTEQLCKKVSSLEMDGTCKAVAVLIGGAEGHDDAVRSAADLLISFGRLTLQHELALVAAVEQIYRVQTLKRGEPYHR
ncbi:MAG: 23S rRNA (pseudouridine(1915)-N(3))-methyltransferase RlmH [Verrucomicrobiota bacterium]|jgi:23S rRNA (pseudouridine1915-N3)-methyltransferase|nr:50S rRNA methyltransferase [Verrucomicrobiales bacterium]MEC9037681.1 23S rRNA (pseudouridine(1915)-N(3))-methyltransferase RlmH [Verrucomicrobiota bacterium]MED5472151.1 23S rRNA (pseudouridine(1915)-N(3))-methyltransferase RlmH [Verrucomicrobiota bacterium]MEE2967604.1 23S rRNA (pseudouridine(1915)-N(3))-methyltransferase RlmH [Verrucomicrobiota bacterium]HAA87083.1 50S rRNA methyltransferase [Verrucomicrobiales bacterium]|tara:strand:+ start:1028 stop:1468 length:441 start_codon:yes stop_codon:yes gene_type:complete